jgi:hypothetical protein
MGRPIVLEAFEVCRVEGKQKAKEGRVGKVFRKRLTRLLTVFI